MYSRGRIEKTWLLIDRGFEEGGMKVVNYISGFDDFVWPTEMGIQYMCC